MTKKKVLIAGASGTAGQSIARAFSVQDNYEIYGLTHREENRPLFENRGYSPVLADLTNREQTRKAITRLKPDILISSVMGSGEQPEKQELVMGKNLIQISKGSGVSTFVYLSVFKSDKKTRIPHFDVKAEIENELKLAGVNYLIIRPATFMDGLFMPWFLQPVKEQNTLVSPMAIDTKISYIHTLDIADLVQHALKQNLANETYTIGGQALSIRDIQQILTGKMQTEINYHQLPLEQVRQMAGDDIALMVDYFNRNDFVVARNTLPEAYTPSLRKFENEIDQYL